MFCLQLPILTFSVCRAISLQILLKQSGSPSCPERLCPVGFVFGLGLLGLLGELLLSGVLAAYKQLSPSEQEHFKLHCRTICKFSVSCNSRCTAVVARSLGRLLRVIQVFFCVLEFVTSWVLVKNNLTAGGHRSCSHVGQPMIPDRRPLRVADPEVLEDEECDLPACPQTFAVHHPLRLSQLKLPFVIKLNEYVKDFCSLDTNRWKVDSNKMFRQKLRALNPEHSLFLNKVSCLDLLCKSLEFCVLCSYPHFEFGSSWTR